jgi:4-O-beta-D-mannosyl-D-glucose phosphorylase
MSNIFETRKELVLSRYEELVSRKNTPLEGNGVITRYANPVITADMVPPFWKYDFNPATNPYFMERIGVNATLNSGAMKWNGKYILVVRVEGADRKSFFAVAESPNGVDNFRFWDHPITMPDTEDVGTNIYDMRLTNHEDGASR